MDYLEEQRALLRKRRLERLIARARRRLERRRARSEAIWTLHVHKTGRQPTVWHTRYERSYCLENDAQLLLIRLEKALDSGPQGDGMMGEEEQPCGPGDPSGR